MMKMYIWQILLKPVLGYFCTLDPLGYDYRQIDIMFMTLGSMVSQLSNTQLGEHQIKMIMAFQRTCQGIKMLYSITCIREKIWKKNHYFSILSQSSQIFNFTKEYLKISHGKQN
jgi:hypothetical protein